MGNFGSKHATESCNLMCLKNNLGNLLSLQQLIHHCHKLLARRSSASLCSSTLRRSIPLLAAETNHVQNYFLQLKEIYAPVEKLHSTLRLVC